MEYIMNYGESPNDDGESPAPRRNTRNDYISKPTHSYDDYDRNEHIAPTPKKSNNDYFFKSAPAYDNPNSHIAPTPTVDNSIATKQYEDALVDKIVERLAEKLSEKAIDKFDEKSLGKLLDKFGEKPLEKILEKLDKKIEENNDNKTTDKCVDFPPTDIKNRFKL